MPEKYSLVMEIFWIQEGTALEGPVLPIRAAPDPPPSNAFSPEAMMAAGIRACFFWVGFSMSKAAKGVIR